MFPPRGRSLLPRLPNTWHPHYQPSLLPRTRSLGAPLGQSYHTHRHHRTIPFPEHALFSYLPVFTARDFRSHSDVDRIVSAWIRHNPETNPALASQLLEEDLRLAFDLVLDALSEADYGEPVHSTSRRMLAELEYCFEEDAQLGSFRIGGQGFRRSQHLFRSLAEISHSARSYPLGSVLVTFFLTYVGKIARANHARALAEWCYAIWRAHMRDDDKISCFARIQRLRPELIEELAAEGSPRSMRVARLLDKAQMYSGSSDLFVRPRGLAPSQWASGPRDFGRTTLQYDGDMHEEYDDYRFAESDSRYLRRLEEDRHYLEIEDERDRRKILQLQLGSRYNPQLLIAPPLGSTERNWPAVLHPINRPQIEYNG